jgi:hypothetical protein
MEIREATESDADAIAELWTQAYVTLGVAGRTKPYTEADFCDSARDGEVLSPTGWAGSPGRSSSLARARPDESSESPRRRSCRGSRSPPRQGGWESAGRWSASASGARGLRVGARSLSGAAPAKSRRIVSTSRSATAACPSVTPSTRPATAASSSASRSDQSASTRSSSVVRPDTHLPSSGGDVELKVSGAQRGSPSRVSATRGSSRKGSPDGTAADGADGAGATANRHARALPLHLRTTVMARGPGLVADREALGAAEALDETADRRRGHLDPVQLPLTAVRRQHRGPRSSTCAQPAPPTIAPARARSS